MSDQATEAPVIELPEPADAPVLARLFQEDMTDLGVETALDDLEKLAEMVIEEALSSPPRCICYVARLDEGGEAVGVVLANFHWSLKFAGRALWIEELYVTPAARRRRLGRRLVEQVLDWAEDHGIRGIDLEAYQGNTPASILYRSLGFYRLGRERFYYRLGPAEYL
ncbi:GNAT family N-acetyltransferase [Lujinxingia litoralis]|nr:GNAT family N-acetyltransferase [Lujinxingia litoralis]